VTGRTVVAALVIGDDPAVVGVPTVTDVPEVVDGAMAATSPRLGSWSVTDTQPPGPQT